jgi:hypothetical protein
MSKLMAALFLVFGTQTAFAGECPVQSFGQDYLDEVVTLIEAKKPSCYEAAQVAEDCAMGTSVDGRIAGAASAVCHVSFTTKLLQADLAAYNSLLQKCSEKYAKMSGTIYVSFEAYCRLDVDKLFSSRYSPAE